MVPVTTNQMKIQDFWSPSCPKFRQNLKILHQPTTKWKSWSAWKSYPELTWLAGKNQEIPCKSPLKWVKWEIDL